MGKFPYSAPIPHLPNSLASDCVVPGFLWLTENQNDDGSWGGDSLLDRVVATCHACMALQSAGFMVSDRHLRGGLEYLASDRISMHTWGFWRIAPMINVPDRSQLVLNDLQSIVDRVHGRSSPHPDQVLELFLMKMLITLGRESDASEYATAILRDFSPANGWFGRADTTTHAIAVLSALDCPPSNMRAMLMAALRVINSQCVRHGPGLISWGGRVSTTAYTIMNLLESPLRDREALRQLASDGASWIASQRQDDGSWRPETPPYGGEGEIVHPAYFTAVSLRGLLAYLDVSVAKASTLVQSSYAHVVIRALESKLVEQHTTTTRLVLSNRRFRIGIFGALTLALAMAALFMVYRFKGVLASHWVGASGITIIAIGTTTVLVFDLFDYFTRIGHWVRGRLAKGHRSGG